MKRLDTAQYNGQKNVLHSITYRTKPLYTAQRAGKRDTTQYEILDTKSSYSAIYREKTIYTAQYTGQGFYTAH